MTFLRNGKSTDFKQTFSNFFDRYGILGGASILSVELIWAASVLIPVLLVIGVIFNFTNAWMAVLPGFLGAITFLIVLTIGGLAATLPSAYLGKWREFVWKRMERRYPAPSRQRQPIRAAATLYPRGLDVQDAD